MYMDSVGKIHTHICTFQCVCEYIYIYIYMHIHVVLIMLIYLNFKKALNSVVNDDFDI